MLVVAILVVALPHAFHPTWHLYRREGSDSTVPYAEWFGVWHRWYSDFETIGMALLIVGTRTRVGILDDPEKRGRVTIGCGVVAVALGWLQIVGCYLAYSAATTQLPETGPGLWLTTTLSVLAAVAPAKGWAS